MLDCVICSEQIAAIMDVFMRVESWSVRVWVCAPAVWVRCGAREQGPQYDNKPVVLSPLSLAVLACFDDARCEQLSSHHLSLV